MMTRDVTMETFIFHPDGPGPFPGVVMYQHIGGLTEALLGMARRLSAGGYYCAVPSLYHRMGTIVIDPENEAAEMGALRKAITAPMRDGRLPLHDTADLLAHLQN